MEKYEESLNKSLSSIRIADHMIYITFPVIKDKRLLLKALDNIYESITGVINSILQYDYLWRRVNLTKDPKQNFEIFLEKSAPRYNITPNETQEIIEFMSLIESHRKSPMEFMRREKVIIMTDSLKTTSLDTEKMKVYLNLAKKLIEKARFVFSCAH